MEKIIHKLISEFTKGIDTYTHNGSTWLIFTESKQWVIELTEEKTLWYNYTFFKSVFEYTSMDVVEHQQYITKWVEDTIIIKVVETHFRDTRDKKQQFENTIKSGVKETLRASYLNVDNVIQDGVKETKCNQSHQDPKFKEVLKNGVKSSNPLQYIPNEIIDYVIENGVKETFDCDWDVPTDLIEDVINDGVKETKVCNYTDPKTQIMTVKWSHCIDEVIENGVKETRPMDDWVNTNRIVTEVIENGTKNPTG